MNSNPNWEKAVTKHVFILSSSGKPIFSKYGDEQEMSTIFGLLQAVISIVHDAGDEIMSIKAGKRKIVFLLKNSLYFVVVSSTNEPEAILQKLIQYLYLQILMILTSKVHDLLASNSSKDLRDLLGTDASALLHSACKYDITSTSIGFEALRTFTLESSRRKEVTSKLSSCVASSNAV
jgi:hypothetical protein